MKSQSLQAAAGAVLAIMAAAPVDASLAHRQLHALEHRHSMKHVHRTTPVKRSTCQFPNGENMVAVTPGSKNAGWAMSPDQECKPGDWCPYACKAGMVSTQWQPGSTYSYPASMNGGLHCKADGTIEMPFPDKPYCVPGTGAVKAVNQCAKPMMWCQTVLPGNEAMLIPTSVDSSAIIAVPDINYWQSTAAHFYLNAPGVGADEACTWGTPSQAKGNWAAIVAGANTDASGQTFVKVGMNPTFYEAGLSKSNLNWGVKIECPDGGCNGLPCEVKPGGIVNSPNAAAGAGGADFCVVTVAKGKTANIVAYDGSGGHASAPQSTPDNKPSPPPKSETPPPPPPKTSSVAPSSSSVQSSSTPTPSSTSSTSSQQTLPPTPPGGIFHESSNSTDSSTSTIAVVSQSAPAIVGDKNKNAAGQQQANTAFVGLVVAFVATVCFF